MLYAITALASAVGFQPVITGTGQVVNGYTLTIADQRVRLAGIDAPDLRQYCYDGQGKAYQCGRRAADALAKLVGQSKLICSVADARAALGICRSSKGDVGLGLIRLGYAVTVQNRALSVNQMRDYAEAERAAKAEKVGLWSGRFKLPARWRLADKRNSAIRASK
jgi:endonuclease YncB( thermonuclease family)